ncbi:hypothetical protein V1477_014920 [Vespula maculifrons]|uniref:Uncharacterized protein n=1 Tax=Vespula maculifrons TaxID=7453 RepID=A0ABD2BIV0_VESMC
MGYSEKPISTAMSPATRENPCVTRIGRRRRRGYSSSSSKEFARHCALKQNLDHVAPRTFWFCVISGIFKLLTKLFNSILFCVSAKRYWLGARPVALKVYYSFVMTVERFGKLMLKQMYLVLREPAVVLLIELAKWVSSESPGEHEGGSWSAMRQIIPAGQRTRCIAGDYEAASTRMQRDDERATAWYLGRLDLDWNFYSQSGLNSERLVFLTRVAANLLF